jgi:hypothetical protein
MKDEHGRILPDFIVVGAMRAGSTALSRLLRRHPQCFMGTHELYFFSRDWNWKRGIDWYAQHFTDWNGEPIVGEKTVSYSYRPALVPSVPERIASVLPSVKLIWTLRDPIDRAYSQYWHAMRYGQEHLDFEAALEARRRPDWRAYRDRGIYVEQIQRYLDFFPREQMRFVRFDDLLASPERTLRPLFDFLGVDANAAIDVQLDVEERNRGGPPRNAFLGRLLARAPLWVREHWFRRLFHLNRSTKQCPPMKEETRDALAEFYRPYNEELRSLIQMDTSTWGRPTALGSIRG